MKTLFDKVNERVNKECNSNCHWNRLDTATRIWLLALMNELEAEFRKDPVCRILEQTGQLEKICEIIHGVK